MVVENRFHSRSDVDAELEVIRNGLNIRGNSQTPSLWSRFVNRPAIYKPFIIIMILSLLQQFSGTTILRAYVVEVFNPIFTKEGAIESQGRNITCPVEKSATTSNNAYISAIIIGTTRLLG